MNFDDVSPKTFKFNIHYMTPYFEFKWLFVNVEFIV